MRNFLGIFKKKKVKHHPKGYHSLEISKLVKLSQDTVEITFNVPPALKKDFTFKPGQCLNFVIEIDGKEEIRSYSICSAANAPLRVAVKMIPNGLVSRWFNSTAHEGMEILASHPTGNFILDESLDTTVAIAAGSGITPILAMAKQLEVTGKKMLLFYGNKTLESTLYKDELDQLKNTYTKYFLSQEQTEGYAFGRIDKGTFVNEIKNNLELLKAGGFYLCGPEDMIIDISETLKSFGVSEDKIHFELYTPPTKMKPKNVAVNTFEGLSSVRVVVDDEEFDFKLAAKGKTILDAAIDEGADAPYSCRGGVCSTCKGKLLKGTATMTLNYSLTDKEVEEGYILTCQARPSSDELIVSYDDV